MQTGKVDLYVPRLSRVSVVLPALLPRRVYEGLGRWFGIDSIFGDLDEKARAAYRSRATG